MELRGVAFKYAHRGPYVLREVDVAFRPGQLVEVTGRNGAGKSTLLKLLAGALFPSRGVVRSRPEQVGYTPEHFPTSQPFTVTQYGTHMGYLRGLAAARSKEVLRESAERLGFTHLLDTRLPELSQGSAQKVGIVQALLVRPGLLVLDEPFAGLDVAARHELHAIVRETAADGGIVVVSDHQGHLRHVPDRTRWHVAETGITVSSAQQQTHSTADADDLSETTIVEVTVPTREAGHLAATLRADGHHVRVRNGGTSEPRRSE